MPVAETNGIRVIVCQFLADRFAIAHQQRKDRRIGPSFAANALAQFL